MMSESALSASVGKVSRLSAAEIGRQFVDGTLAASQWNHEAHFAAALHLLMDRKDLDVSTAMPRLIRRYNSANGVQNDESSGFHATLTEFYLRMIRLFLRDLKQSMELEQVFTTLLASEIVLPDFPLQYYSCARLFSPEARRRWIPPDLRPQGYID